MLRPICFFMLLLAISCAAVKHRYYMGMSEAEWKKKNMSYRVVEMNENGTVYRIPNTTGAPSFVYFDKNGKLVRVTEGQRGPDVIIENRH